MVRQAVRRVVSRADHEAGAMVRWPRAGALLSRTGTAAQPSATSTQLPPLLLLYVLLRQCSDAVVFVITGSQFLQRGSNQID